MLCGLANSPYHSQWGLVLEKEGDHGGMSRKEMYGNSNIFMIAGTETTATLLSGLTYHLLVNPDKLKKLTSEIRAAFKAEDDITIERLQTLRYLHACMEEGLRIYPPVPSGLPRIVPPGGVELDGQFVPAGVSYMSVASVYNLTSIPDTSILNASGHLPKP
jgi:cytochrome P450